MTIGRAARCANAAPAAASAPSRTRTTATASVALRFEDGIGGLLGCGGRSGVQPPAERRDVAAGHRHLGAVAHDEHGGSVELRAQLDCVGEVHEIGAVYPR